VNVVIVDETMARERERGGVHCMRVSARARQAEDTGHVHIVPCKLGGDEVATVELADDGVAAAGEGLAELNGVRGARGVVAHLLLAVVASGRTKICSRGS
jgi:hypothetical protein